MTNKEKYAEMMLDMVIREGIFAVNNGTPCLCNDISCAQCELHNCANCTDQLIEWLNEEYVESPVDWSKVPIDTPILVRDYENQEWKKRHFAGLNPGGKVMGWEEGTTSWTSNARVRWIFAKLAAPEELEG